VYVNINIIFNSEKKIHLKFIFIELKFKLIQNSHKFTYIQVTPNSTKVKTTYVNLPKQPAAAGF